MTKQKLPNQDLIRHLIDQYYDSQSNSDDKQYMSSYWKHYSQLFEMTTDDAGNLISITGNGFGGSCKWGQGYRRYVKQTFDITCILSHLFHLRNRRQIIKLMFKAAGTCRMMDLDLTLDVFRQICTIALLNEYIPETMRRKRLHVLMIGDGYGVLSSLFREIFPNSSVALVDIGKSLLFQAHYCQKAHIKSIHERVGKADLDHVDFLYCPAERLDMLSDFRFDIAINIASMQEMNGYTISRYFSFLRKVLQKDQSVLLL